MSDFGAWATTNALAKAGTNANRITATQIRVWQRKFEGKTPEERWYITLLDDSAGMGLWMDAAGNITKPIRSGSRDATNAPVMQGESLRAKQHPSVTDLLVKRIQDTTPRGIDYYHFPNACSFAGMLVKWDTNAAIPILRLQMSIAMTAADSTDYGFLNYGQEAAPAPLWNIH